MPLPFRRLPAVPPAIQGPLWMSLAAVSFGVMIVLVRYLTAAFDPLQVVFFRCFFGLVAMLPWLLGKGLVVLRTQRIWLHVLRALVAIVAMTMWFTTLALMPLAEATALSFVAPVFTSILAGLFLGEIMRIRRWTATAVSFAGALLILRPGFETVEPAALLALATALVWGTGSIVVKVLARTESSATVVTWFSLFVTPLALVPALFVWQTPTLEQLGWLGLLGISGSVGHICVARSLAVADAGLIAPFDYLRLPVVALIAFFAFGEVPDVWVWVGGGVIAASSLYIAHREARADRGLTPGPVAPAAGP